MRHTRNWHGLAALLAIGLLGAPVRGDSGDKPKDGDLKQTLDQINETFKKIDKNFRSMDGKLQDIDEQLKEFEKRLKRLETERRSYYEPGSNDSMRAEIDRLRDEVALLRDERARLKKRIAQLESDRGRRAFYEGPGSIGETGTIRIENQNATFTAYVTVNGTTYTLPPGQGKSLNGMPAGDITYSITASNGLGQSFVTQPTKTSVLRANHTMTITINPS